LYRVCIVTYKNKSQVKRYEKPDLRLVDFFKDADCYDHNGAIFETRNRKLAEFILRKNDIHPYDPSDFEDLWEQQVTES